MIAAQAQTSATLTTLMSFTNDFGGGAALLQGGDGNLYGVAQGGGSTGYGCAYRLTPGGVYSRLASFAVTNCRPSGPLLLASDGNFYGVTSGAGCGAGHGTVYQMTPGGTVTTLYSFTGNDGIPSGRLVQAGDGSIYGTSQGGTIPAPPSSLRMASSPTSSPSVGPTGSIRAGLIQGQDGNCYGTTYYGGSAGLGTVFRMTTGGELTTLVSFTNTARVLGGLVQATDGNFYGTDGGHEQ